MIEFNDYVLPIFFPFTKSYRILYRGEIEDKEKYINNCKLLEDILFYASDIDKIIKDKKNAPDWYKCVIEAKDDKNVTYYSSIIDYLAKPYKPYTPSYESYSNGKIVHSSRDEYYYRSVAKPATKPGRIEYEDRRTYYSTPTSNEREVRNNYRSMVKNNNKIYKENAEKNINLMNILFEDLHPSIVTTLVSNTHNVNNETVKEYFDTIAPSDTMTN